MLKKTVTALFHRIVSISYTTLSALLQKNKLVFIYSRSSENFNNLDTIINYGLNCSPIIISANENLARKLFYIAKAKIICIDQTDPLLSKLSLSKDTDVIQIWHAGGAYKCFGTKGLDYTKDLKSEISRVYRINRNVTYAICSDEKLIDIYSEAFDIDQSNVFPLGNPRTDHYYRHPNKKNKKGNKILFAPTFRTSTDGSRQISIELIQNVIKQLCKLENYSILIRMHPSIQLEENVIPANVRDVSREKLSSVLNEVDVLITDYSSIIFDYSVFDGMVIFYVPDIDEYMMKRHLYFDPREKYPEYSTQSLDGLLFLLDHKKNNTKEIFFEFMSACDGESTLRVCNFINNLMEK